MVDASGPGGVRKCHGMALADLGDVEGFGRDGKEDRIYAFQLQEGVYKRKEVTLEGGAQTFGELTDIDTSHAVPKQLHSLVFTGSKWVTLADPVPHDGWLIDMKVSSPYVITGKLHKLRKLQNGGTRLCSFIPETKNVVVSVGNLIGTRDGRQGTLKLISEFAPPGLIGMGLPTATIILEVVLGTAPDDFVPVLPGFKLKWPSRHADQKVGIHILVKEVPETTFTLEGMEMRVERRFLGMSKVFIGPTKLKRLRVAPGELSLDQTAAIVERGIN